MEYRNTDLGGPRGLPNFLHSLPIFSLVLQIGFAN